MTVSHEVCSCGLVAADNGGPVHPYVVTSAGCWAVFSKLLADTSDRLFTDAYMAQHVEGDDPRQIQSIAVHLTTLHAVLGHGVDTANASKITSIGVEVGRRMGGYPKLDAPSRWPHNVGHVEAGAVSAREFVDSVYGTWLEHDRDTPEKWTEEVLRALYGNS